MAGNLINISKATHVKALFTGVGMAAMAGILLGGAMKPDLRGDDRPEGPQVFAGWSGVRSTGPFDPGTSFASYGGQVPDYVVGTDWKAVSFQWKDDAAYEPAPIRDYYDEARAEPLPAVEPYREPTRIEPLYPSLNGGAASYASDRVPDHAALPPQPPEQTVNLDEEAPPEATGDTRPAI